MLIFYLWRMALGKQDSWCMYTYVGCPVAVLLIHHLSLILGNEIFTHFFKFLTDIS